MDIARILNRMRPGSHWALDNNDYNTLVWLDENSEKPTLEEIESYAEVAIYEDMSDDVRSKRDQLLQDCDWIVIKYKELGKTVPKAWKEYRQALRDITTQDQFPYLIEWPEEPKEP